MPAAGLCDRCIYQRRMESPKGSTFSLCERALRDPVAFVKYPRLPVLACQGFVTLRAADFADLPAIQAIYAHWVLTGVASFEIDPPTVEEIHRRFNEIAALGLPYIVAVAANGEIAGYAYAALYRPRLAYRFTVEDSIYLHPNYAGQGIGKVLLENLISETSRQGYKQMIAVIGGGMENAGSVALHVRCGFEHIGVLKAVGFKFERWLDTALMQRPLGS